MESTAKRSEASARRQGPLRNCALAWEIRAVTSAAEVALTVPIDAEVAGFVTMI